MRYVRWLREEIRYRAILLGYWIRPLDMMLDARRWRWQESGCSQSRRWAAKHAHLFGKDSYQAGEGHD